MTKTKRFVFSSTLAMMAIVLQSFAVDMSAKAFDEDKNTTELQKNNGEISWYKSLNKAEDDAGREGKLILWLHTSGKLDSNALKNAPNSANSARNSFIAELTSEPVFSMVKNDFLVGYTNIENKKYAAAAGKRKPEGTFEGNPEESPNGAEPRNSQIFVLAPDGTIMTCLPGYWQAEDLAKEMSLAKQLGTVWHNSKLSLDEKKMQFSQLHLDHIATHGQDMKNRSHLQSSDLQFELRHNPNSDFFYSARAIDPATLRTPAKNVKSVDIVMHQRLAAHPFEGYESFDVAAYSAYGDPNGTKTVKANASVNHSNENAIPNDYAPSNAASKQDRQAQAAGDPTKPSNAGKSKSAQSQAKRIGGRVARTTVNQGLRYGIRALLH